MFTTTNCHPFIVASSNHSANDVIVYNIDAAKTDRTAVSFYIKNPKSYTMLTMTTDQIDKMVVAEREALESDLDYK